MHNKECTLHLQGCQHSTGPFRNERLARAHRGSPEAPESVRTKLCEAGLLLLRAEEGMICFPSWQMRLWRVKAEAPLIESVRSPAAVGLPSSSVVGCLDRFFLILSRAQAEPGMILGLCILALFFQAQGY